jgi:hypothetical protein
MNKIAEITDIIEIIWIIDLASASPEITPVSMKLVTQSIKNVLKSTIINFMIIFPIKHAGRIMFYLLAFQTWTDNTAIFLRNPLSSRS